MKIVISVLGLDRVGIIAMVSTVLAENGVNILDVMVEHIKSSIASDTPLVLSSFSSSPAPVGSAMTRLSVISSSRASGRAPLSSTTRSSSSSSSR